MTRTRLWVATLTIVSAALAVAAGPTKSRWRSLATGNLFEVTDFGDRLSIRFVASEVLADEGVERSDVSVSLDGGRRQLQPGRWLLQKRGDGTYVGTANQTITCTYCTGSRSTEQFVPLLGRDLTGALPPSPRRLIPHPEW